MFPKMEESALGSLLAKRVKAYFQDKEHQKEFEEWYLKKYGKRFEGGYYHEGKRMIKSDVDTFRVGDIIKFKLTDGEKVQAMAVQQENDGMLFCLVDCLADEYSMNDTNTNEGGYEGSDLRKKLNTEIIARFPADIKAMMVPFGNGDYLRLPTEKRFSVRTTMASTRVRMCSSGSL